MNLFISIWHKLMRRLNLILPILRTTQSTFLVEIQKAVLSLLDQAKRKKALLASNLSGIT
jgi:hypothetical protein